MATSTFNFNPEGPGGILIGNPGSSGGYTALSLSITNDKNGKTYIQGVSASGTTWGELQLNPYGGLVAIPSISAAPKDVKTVPLVIDPNTGRIYKAS
jgi:hypothetical protein